MSVLPGRAVVESVPIGPHTVEIEGDCMLVRLHGPFTLEQIQKWCDLADRVIETHGQLFTISDFSAGGSFPAATRHHISYWPNVVAIRGSVIFGTSLMTSVVFSMIARATALVRKHTPPTAALKTESEARAWVAELRQKPTSAATPR